MSLTGNQKLTTSKPFVNDGFWPDLMLGDLLEDYRIPADYADEVIQRGLVMAMIRVNENLLPVKTALTDLAFASLAGYTAANISKMNGQDILFLEYQHAVFCRAKAGLLAFRSVNTKVSSDNLDKQKDLSEQYWLDKSQSSIKAFFDLILPENTTLGKAGAHVVLL